MTTIVRDAILQTCAIAEAHAQDADRQARFPCEALSAMRANGLLGLMVPSEFGGIGGTLTDLVDATVEMGRRDLSLALVFAMHCQQTAVLAEYAGDRLRAHVLPAVASGLVYLASVTTEPKTGGHLLSSQSPVRQDGNLLQIDREAPVVTGGQHADGFLITVLSPDATSPAQVSLVYVARDQLDVQVLAQWDPLGMRATESVPMHLRGSVPCWQEIGTRGGFRTMMTTTFAPLAHVGWSAAWLGTAVGAYSRVIRYIRCPAGRQQFDPSSDLLRTRLAQTRARLETVHALLRHTVSVLDSGQDAGAAHVQMLINALKVQASRECFAAVDELVELTGLRYGYMRQSPLGLERAFRDLRSASLNYGNDRLRLATGSLALMDTGVRLA